VREVSFQIQLQVRLPEQSGILSQLSTEISQLAGITQIDIQADGASERIEITVTADNQKSQEAQQLHRKIMKILQQTEGVVISGISYDLNVMFSD